MMQPLRYDLDNPDEQHEITEWINGDYVKYSDHQAQLESLQSKYDEIIMSVENKYPNETRHETAVRYIRQRESACREATTEALQEKDNAT